MTTTSAGGKAFAEVIRERRSVRQYDPAFKLSDEDIRSLLADAVLAPSSSNLQPWRFLVIRDDERKRLLLPIANNQKQVAECSAVIAVLGDLDAYKQAESIYGRAVEAGHMPPEVKERMVERTVAGYGGMSDERRRSIALIDGGLVSMQLMLAAKARGLDTVPMGGYNAEMFKEAFRVPDRYEPVMLIAVGKAAVEGRPTARLRVDEVTFWDTF